MMFGSDGKPVDPSMEDRRGEDGGWRPGRTVEEKTVGKTEPKVNLQVQIPEVSHAKVDGEWLIPRDGILLVSLGVDTVADDRGKAVVRERIAVLEVAPASPGPALTQPHLEGGRPWPAPSPRLSMPATPARAVPGHELAPRPPRQDVADRGQDVDFRRAAVRRRLPERGGAETGHEQERRPRGERPAQGVKQGVDVE